VHPPEDEAQKIPRGQNSLHIVSRQLSRYLYPVHRLDRATSGVLVFGMSVDSARVLAESFREHRARKIYYCVVRGWLEGPGVLDRPLKPERGDGPELESVTAYEPLARIELPLACDRYPTSRYTLVRAEPETGRFHQIRRHFAGASHPLIGDSMHGHRPHNHCFRDKLKIPGLLLKAASLEVPHPETGEPLHISSRWEPRWQKVFDLFGVCPFTGGSPWPSRNNRRAPCTWDGNRIPTSRCTPAPAPSADREP
jgi:tRNA pseudouridine65 synthase